MNQFNLSDKIHQMPFTENSNCINVKDVKEFIKQLKEEIHSVCDMETTTNEDIIVLDWVSNKIDKLAGKDLI